MAAKTGKKQFKVIIAGGSIAGLALANMLAKLDIDFVVLEKYPSIAPQVGASIGMLANGIRILDQLGIFPRLIDLMAGSELKTFLTTGPDGRELCKDNIKMQLQGRHGYPCLFLDRQMVVQALYDHLPDKTKVLSGKAVNQVRLLESGVEVETKDSEVFTGDILIGADGIHSAVRGEMWRLANERIPGYIPASEENAMPCDYKCIFGISLMPEYRNGAFQLVYKKNFSYLVCGGPGDRRYWVLFVNLGKTHYGNDIPRFTKADEELLANQHLDDKIDGDVTFGELYRKRITSVLTALPEYVFKKWHFDRIMTVGDSAHKFEPISGQGGNNAIESAAELCNNLFSALEAHPGGLSTVDIEHVFAATQETRQPRAEELVGTAHQLQVLTAMENPVMGSAVQYVTPRLLLDSRMDLLSSNFEGAHRLNMVPVPERVRFVPYNDELPARPLGTVAWFLPKLVAAALLGALLVAAQRLLVVAEPTALEMATFAGSTAPLKRKFTGIEGLDLLLAILVEVFGPAVAGPDINQRLQAFYFLFSLLPVCLIWTLEGYRRGNYRSLVSVPLVFGVLYQLLGIGKVAPAYYLISLYTTSTKLYTRPTGRFVHSSVAKALPLALILGFLVPTLLMLAPLGNPVLTQNFIALWQGFPLYVALFTFITASLIQAKDKSPPTDEEMYELKDVAPLRSTYAFVFLATVVAHVGSAVFAAAHPAASLPEAFLNLAEANPVFAFFKYDMWLFFGAVWVWSLYSVFELRRVGYVRTETAVLAAVVVLGAQIVVGPAAAYTGLWWWRENVITQRIVAPKKG